MSRPPSSFADIRRDNILAPFSLFTGIAAWTLLPVVGALAAMLFGHIAYAKSRRLNVGGRGMALAGLVLGYSGLAAAAVLVGILIALPDGRAPSAAAGQAATPQAAAPAAAADGAGGTDTAAARESGADGKTPPPVIPPAALPILALQQAVAERMENGEPLDEISEDWALDDRDRRYWERMEAKQGNIILATKANAQGMSRQIRILSAQDGGTLVWSCVGGLDKEVEETVCH